MNNVYFGLGICGRNKISIGLPFDVLTLFLLSEKVRRMRKASCVFIHLADSHATINGFTVESISQISKQYEKIINRIILSLNLINHKLVLASQLSSNNNYIKLFNSLGNFGNKYLQMEIADMLWYKNNKFVDTKIGWQYADYNRDKIDEHFFDKTARALNINIDFIYSNSAIYYDNKKLKFASPYIAYSAKERLIFGYKDKYNFNDIDSYAELNHYFKSIVLLYQELYKINFPKKISQAVNILYDKIMDISDF